MNGKQIRVAAERNVQRLDSLGVALALGSLTVGELQMLENNLTDRLLDSHHDWKDEQLSADLNKVAGEFAIRGLGEQVA